MNCLIVTQIPVIYTLATSTFHTPCCHFIFLPFLLYPSNAAVFMWFLSVIKSQGGDVPAATSAGETTQAFSLLFPYFKHLTKLAPCAQSKVLWLIVQTALSACVSMSREGLGSWPLPVPWLMSLCSGWAFHTKGLFSIYSHFLQHHLCGIEIHNQQSAMGKNMFQLILNEQWVNFFSFFFFFKELIMRKTKIASSSEPVTDLRYYKFQSEHKAVSIPQISTLLIGKCQKCLWGFRWPLKSRTLAPKTWNNGPACYQAGINSLVF